MPEPFDDINFLHYTDSNIVVQPTDRKLDLRTQDKEGKCLTLSFEPGKSPTLYNEKNEVKVVTDQMVSDALIKMLKELWSIEQDMITK